MNKIHILLLSEEDWSKKYKIPPHVEIQWLDKQSELKTKLMEVVILDRNITFSERQLLQTIARGYCLFATENVNMKFKSTKKFFDGKMGQYLYTGDIQEFLDTEVEKYFLKPYGEKFSPSFLTVSSLFQGKIVSNGNYHMAMQGDFGKEFQQVAYWKQTIPLFENQTLDLYLEYEKSGTVEIQLNIWQFYNGSVGDIQQTWSFDEAQLKNVVQITNRMNDGPFFASIAAKGDGTLIIKSLHDRHSRQNLGYFLPGGQRITNSHGEEVFAYFEKGDCKPPLAIYFSSYREQEGFQGYSIMRSFGCPFLLLTEPRLAGGGFYVGDEEYEGKLLNIILEKMKLLKFSGKDIILSGMSMGTFGSLYYGAKLHPHALLLSKPLANLGNMAKQERIGRLGIFPTSLDVLYKNYGSLNEDAIQAFNERLWNQFDQADWSNTKFIMSYLYEDDYDVTAYQDILQHLKDNNVQVYGKGNHGRHNDNGPAVLEWFVSQYKKILREDFQRKNLD